ncbi:MAG: hypothetical protein EA398_17310 [Deltaproteobacteria bacterium]|nr:MAG: hypothetical protein EA398_17310 [Deltaproteobacteria bacterium]
MVVSSDAAACAAAEVHLRALPAGGGGGGPALQARRELVEAQIAHLEATGADIDARVRAVVEADANGALLLEVLADRSERDAAAVAVRLLMRHRGELAPRFVAVHHLARGGEVGIDGLVDVIARHEGGAGSERSLESGVRTAVQYPLAALERLWGPGAPCADVSGQRACAYAAIEASFVVPELLDHLEPERLRRLLQAERAAVLGDGALQAWEAAAEALRDEDLDLLLDSVERLEQSGMEGEALMRVRLQLLSARPRSTALESLLLQSLLGAGASLADERSHGRLRRTFETVERDARPMAALVAVVMVKAGMAELPEAALERLANQAGRPRGRTGVLSVLALARHRGDAGVLRDLDGEVSAELVAAVSSPDPAPLLGLMREGTLPQWQLSHAAGLWSAGRWEEWVAALSTELEPEGWWLERVLPQLGRFGAPLALELSRDGTWLLAPRVSEHVIGELVASSAWREAVLSGLASGEREIAERALALALRARLSVDAVAELERLYGAEADPDGPVTRSGHRWGVTLLALRASADGTDLPLDWLERERTARAPQGPGYRELGILVHDAWRRQCGPQ